MKTYYIGADVHNNNTELAIEHSGNIVCRRSVPTTIPAIKEVLASVALCAISSNENVFKCYYERMIYEGMIPSNARHAVARKMLTVNCFGGPVIILFPL